MPSITLTFTPAQAARIQAALGTTPYPQDAAGYKRLLVDYTRTFVQEYEKAAADKTALAAVALPADITVA